MAPDPVRAAFEAWERPCRGYQTWDHPVDLEPLHQPIEQVRVKQQSDQWRTLYGSDPLSPAALAALGVLARPAHLVQRELVELQLVLPEPFLAKPGNANRLLQQLHLAAFPVSFELIGVPGNSVIQFCCGADDEDFVRGALRSFYPDVQLKAVRGFLEQRWQQPPHFTATIGFGLCQGFHLPLSRRVGIRSDPLIGIATSLQRIQKRELAVFQVVFHRVTQPWGADLWEILSVADWAADMRKLARGKMSDPLVAVTIRIAVQGTSTKRANDRAREVGAAVVAASRSEHNYLIPLSNEGYADGAFASDFIRRTTHRSGIVLTLSELHTFVHPTAPSACGGDGELRTKARRRKVETAEGHERETVAQSVLASTSSAAARHESPKEAQNVRLIAKDAAAYLGIAPQTLAKMRVAGSSPPYYKVGRQVLYARSELDMWLAARRRRSTSDSSR